MKEIWQRFWMAVLGLFIALAFCILIWVVTSDKPILRYYIDSSPNTSTINIRVEIQNCNDSYFTLSGMSYWEAYRFVDSLNTELQRHPRSK